MNPSNDNKVNMTPQSEKNVSNIKSDASSESTKVPIYPKIKDKSTKLPDMSTNILRSGTKRSSNPITNYLDTAKKPKKDSDQRLQQSLNYLGLKTIEELFSDDEENEVDKYFTQKSAEAMKKQ